MKTGTVVNLRGFKFFDFLRKNHMLLIMCIFLIIGIAAGTFGNSRKVYGMTEDLLNYYLSKRMDCSFISSFASSALTFVISLLICFVFGASMMGVAVIPVFIGIIGFWYGSIASFLYSVYALKGVAFNALILLPCLLIFFVTMVFSASEGVAFSLILAKSTLPKSRPMNLYIDFKNYCARYSVFLLFIILAAFLDAVLSHTFIGFFKF